MTDTPGMDVRFGGRTIVVNFVFRPSIGDDAAAFDGRLEGDAVMTSTSWHGEDEQAKHDAWLDVRAVACRQAARAGVAIAVPRERAGVDAPRLWEHLEFRICGARPRRGDGTLWCERPAGHAGLHHGDGMSFSARNPRERVTTSGRLVAESAQRRSSR